MRTQSCLAIILAAGLGTRMKSQLPKVLHEVGGLSLVGHVLGSVRAAQCDKVAVVIGADMPELAAHVAALDPAASVHEQVERLGTAHAARSAAPAYAEPADHILVLFGDTPLVTPETIVRVRQRLTAGADLVVLGFEAADPTGYGRLLTEGDALTAIREEKDASAAERAVTFCNSGIMGFRGAHFAGVLEAIGNANAQNEFYLTDAVEIARAQGLTVAAETAPEAEVQGINTRVQLAAVEAEFQSRCRRAAMLDGATLVAPETVFFSHDTRLGRDVVIEPNVVFAPGVSVADGTRIRAFSHLEGAEVGARVTAGPYARLRPGARIGAGAHIGNFVEIKNARVDEGAKVNHLSYIGDATVGAKANIGAGTITCNYDGFGKHLTEIGANCFVGSNSTLVAPVRIGDGAYLAAGSVVTEEVPAEALALGRARQTVKPGKAGELRARFAAAKAEKAAKAVKQGK